MDVSKAVDQRISTRAFLPDALPESEVRDWLEQAQRAPSGGNTQPWRTIIVSVRYTPRISGSLTSRAAGR